MSAVNEEKKTAHQGTASHKTEPCCHTTFDGKVVSMTGNKLVVANKEGKECSHTLATDAKLTRDGTKCVRLMYLGKPHKRGKPGKPC